MDLFRKELSLLLLAFLLLLPARSYAQRFSVGTNAVEWINLGTVNGEVGAAVGQHFSVHAGARYNGWTFRRGDPADRFIEPTGDSEKQFENRQQTYSLGLRFWPWYVYSGWWFYARGQYSEYNRGGLRTHSAEEGDAYGAGFGAGYTYMVHKNWNVEFGAGLWGGAKTYKVYRCTNCGSVTGGSETPRPFFALDDVFVSLIYIF